MTYNFDMKKLLLLIVLSFFSTQGFTASCPDGSEPQKTVSADGTYFIYECAGSADSNKSHGKSQTSHKLDTPANWPGGIKYATETSANAILYFDEAKKPERLYINSSDRPPHNVAYTGNIETPISYYGFWPKGAYSKYSPYSDFYLEKFTFEEGIDEIVDGNDHVQRGFDVENKEVFSFHLQKFHNGDKESLETLKSMMLEWVNGPYWEAMIPDRNLACTTCSNEQPLWEGYNFSILGELWNTLIPMLEVHITLIREEAYSTKEYDLAHKWLEKRVWLAEQGPAEGQLASAHRWIPDPGPPNHHKIRKSLGYLMWGVADQNSEYFTAGVRGVEQYYNVLRNDGSITTEHFHDKACQTGFNDHGCRNGLSLGNETGKFYALGAIIMHNQGIDVRKKYPKFERNIEWTTQVAVEPSLAMKWIGNIFVEERRGSTSETWSKEGINMDWARNWAGIRKNLSHIYLWDNIFQTNYGDNLKSVYVIDQGKNMEEIYDHVVRRAYDFGMVDTGLITFNPDEVLTGITLDQKSLKVGIDQIEGDIQKDYFHISNTESIRHGDYVADSNEFFLDGDSSEKFSIQPLDCDNSKSKDCDNNQQRLMMVEKDKITTEGTRLYEWSMYLPEDHKFPLGSQVTYNRFIGEDTCQSGSAATFVEYDDGIYLSLPIAGTFRRDDTHIIQSKDLTGRWHNFKLEVNWSKLPEQGYIKLILNDIFVHEYKGQTLRCDEASFTYGLLRSDINEGSFAKITPSSVYFDNVKISNIDESNPSIFLEASLGKSTKKIEGNDLFDGRYRFTVFRHNEDEGAMILGAGDIEIKNGELIIETENSYLSTGPKDLYDTFEGQISEDGEVTGSIELDILGGKDRSEVYNLNGSIDDRIWGESPKEDFFKVYLTLREK